MTIENPSKMIVDSNAFIESKNRFYAFDICPGFWDFMEDDFSSGNSTSIVHVRNELLAGEDELSAWVKNVLAKKLFYDCLADERVFESQLEVAQYVMDLDVKQSAKDVFLAEGVADPWLVAYARVHGGTIVTQEISMPSAKKKVSLIDVCDHFGVHHINVYEYLRRQKVRFSYSR